MKFIKRIFTLFLINSLCLSSAFVSLAEVSGNVDNNNNQSSVTGAGGDFGCNTNTQSRTGYRMYLVSSENPSEIVSVNDAGEPIVIDIWFMTKENFQRFVGGTYLTKLEEKNYFTATKFQSWDTRNAYEMYLWDDISNIEPLNSLPHWMQYNDTTKKYYTTGLDLQKWEKRTEKYNGEFTEYGNILNMLANSKSRSGTWLFKTKDTLGKVNKDGRPVTVVDENIPSNKKYKLCIEPIFMLSIVARNTQADIVHPKVAGTFSNLAEYWQTVPVLVALESKYGAESFLNYKALNQTGVHALGVSETMIETIEHLTWIGRDALALIVEGIEVENIVRFSNGNSLSKAKLSEIPTWKEMSEANKWKSDGAGGLVKDGFAINVFSLDGMLLSNTHTWDSITYPDGSPGKAPESRYISEKDNEIKIVKYYEDKLDGSLYKTTGIYGRESCLRDILVENEPQYKVKEFFVSTKEESYVENGVTPSYEDQKAEYNDGGCIVQGTGSINIKEPGKVLHILLQKEDSTKGKDNTVSSSQIELYQNEISRPYSLETLCSNKELVGLYEHFVDKSGYKKTCTRSHDLDDDCRGNDEDGYWCDGDHDLPGYSVQIDGSYQLSVKDDFDYNNGTTFIRDYVTSNTEISGSLGLCGGDTLNLSPNSSFLFYRNSVKDSVTLYPEKNNNNLKQRLNDFGIKSESYIPAGKRAGKTSLSDSGESFKDTLETHYIDTTTDRKFEFAYECEFNHVFGNMIYESDKRMLLDDLNKQYSQSGNALTHVFLGYNNLGNMDPSDKRDTFLQKYGYNKGYSSVASELKFYPYIKMDKIEKDSTIDGVYVTSENLSTMKVFNVAQIGVYKKNEINVFLDSTQFSTHAKSLSFLNKMGIKNKKSVLPGGATVDLTMGNKGDTQIGIRLYQACLPDAQVKKVADNTSFNTSLTEAKKQANSFIKEAITSLSGYGLEMYGAVNTQKTTSDLLKSGKPIHSGDTLPWLVDRKTAKAGSDEKYYLKHDGSGANRANLDVLDNKIVKQVYYEISSDINGTVYLKKDGAIIGQASNTQNASTLLANSELKLLDDNTKLITNYFNSIDRNKGKTKDGKSWYNEAFDGIGYLVTDIAIDLGFNPDSSIRTTIIDTKLLGTSESKTDLYNFEEESIRSLGYFTTKQTSSEVSKKGLVGFLAMLPSSENGAMKEMVTKFSDINTLAYTKNVFINNFSVSDLN